MTLSSLLTTADLERYLRDLKANDCEVERDKEAGTVTAFDGEDRVLAAIRKGPGGPWIVRFIDSDRITWTPPERT